MPASAGGGVALASSARLVDSPPAAWFVLYTGLLPARAAPESGDREISSSGEMAVARQGSFGSGRLSQGAAAAFQQGACRCVCRRALAVRERLGGEAGMPV